MHETKAGMMLPARYWYPLAILLLICIGVGVYYPFLSTQRGTDDNAIYFENHAVREQGHGWVTAALYSDTYRPLWRPLTLLSYRMNWESEPRLRRGPALTNLVLMILVGITATILLRKIGAGVLASVAAGVMLLVHPIQTESIVRLAGRSELLSNLFLLIAFAIFIIGAKCKPDRSNRWRIVRWALWAFLFWAALLSKETALILPFLALGFELTRALPGRGRRLLTMAIVSIIVITSWGALRYGVINGWPDKIKSRPAPDYVASLTSSERFNVACSLPILYSGMIFGAREILPDYSHLLSRPVDAPPIEIGKPQSFWVTIPPAHRVAAGIAIPLAALALFIAFRRRWPLFAFGCWWFGVGILAVLPLLGPNGVVASSRFLALPFLGLFLAITALLSRLFSRGAGTKTVVRALLIPGVSVLLLGIVAANRSVGIARAWATQDSLMTYLQEKAPASPEVPLYRGARALQRRDFEHAASQFEESLGFFPRNPRALLNLALLRAQQGQRGIATRLFADAAVVASVVIPGSATECQTHLALGTLLTEQNLPEQAMEQFKLAHAIDSTNVQVEARLGILELNIRTRQSLVDGIRHVDRVLALDPDGKQIGSMKPEMIRLRNYALSILRNSEFADELPELEPIKVTGDNNEKHE